MGVLQRSSRIVTLQHEWWTTYAKTGASDAAAMNDPEGQLSVGKECWTGKCICDEGSQEDITEDDLAQLIRDTVDFQGSDASSKASFVGQAWFFFRRPLVLAGRK